MNNNKCPLCGKETVEGEGFCRDCQDNAKARFSEDLLNQTSSDSVNADQIVDENDFDDNTLFNEDVGESSFEETVVEEDSMIYAPRKRVKKALIFFIVGLIVLVVVGGAGSYFHIKHKQSVEVEEAYWSKCVEENTPFGYSKYLLQYPEGVFSEEAEKRIYDLRKSEEEAWNKLKKSSEVSDYTSFLMNHPESPYKDAALRVLDSIYWVKAKEFDTVEGYKAYLDNANLGNLSGNFKEEAQERYDYLSQLKVLEGKELIALKKQLSGFFQLLSKKDYKALRKQCDSVFISFNGTKNLLSDKVLTEYDENLKSEKIKNVVYSLNLDSLEAIQDDKQIKFLRNINITQTKNYQNRKKKAEKKSIQAKVQINKDGLFSAFDIE